MMLGVHTLVKDHSRSRSQTLHYWLTCDTCPTTNSMGTYPTARNLFSFHIREFNATNNVRGKSCINVVRPWEERRNAICHGRAGMENTCLWGFCLMYDVKGDIMVIHEHSYDGWSYVRVLYKHILNTLWYLISFLSIVISW